MAENGAAELSLVSTSLVQSEHIFLDSAKLYFANLPLRS